MEAIPGFRSEQDSEDVNNTVITIEVKEGQEWRFEVPFKLMLVLKVVQGVGEIFGTELPVNSELQFTGVKYSVYAPLPEGCKLEYYIKSNRDNATTSNEVSEISEYISDDNAMKQYINLHYLLESKRQEITDYNLVNSLSVKLGPKVLILGNRYCGKTVVSKILSSYAFKMDHQPVLVNLNPRDGVFSLPGSISATPISDNFDLESINGYGTTVTSGTTYHNPKQPLVKNCGFEDFALNLDYYKHQVSQLGITLLSRFDQDRIVNDSGCIIDTPPLTIKDISLIENIVADFEVDVIVVIGNDKFLMDLKRKFNHKILKNQLFMLKVPKSDGVVELDDSYIRKCQEETIKQYFNGNFRNVLSPFKTEITASDFAIYKVMETSAVNSSLLFAPAGDSFEPDATGSTDNTLSNDTDHLDKYLEKAEDLSITNLENLIVAITQLPLNNKLQRDLLNTNVLGYIHVSKYEESKGKLKVLMPVPGTFPRNVLIATNIGYSE